MPAILEGASAGGELPGGYGVALLQAVLALGAVCLLAWVVLRWLGKRGFGTGARGTGRIRVVERTPLDAHRALYLVEVGDRVWLVGAGEGASPSLLAELDPSELPPLPESGERPLAGVLGRLKRQGKGAE